MGFGGYFFNNFSIVENYQLPLLSALQSVILLVVILEIQNAFEHWSPNIYKKCC